MKKFSKAILIALAVLVALVVAALVGVNLYLQSPGVQARIQEELSRALRLPLTITNTSFTPWSDLRITGITIPNGDANLLEAVSISARYRLVPLLQRRLVIHQVTVESPKIVWVQDQDGKWKLPEPEKAAAVSAASPPTTATTPAPEPAVPEVPEPSREPEEKKPSNKKSELAVIVESGQIKHGTIELLDHANVPVATLTDVTIEFSKLTADRVEGTAQIGRAVWEKVFVLEEVRTPFTYAHGTIELPALDARLGGGFLKGRVTWNPTADRSPFTSALEFQHIDLARISADAGWTEGDAAGSLRGTLSLAGSSQAMERAEGAAQLFLRNGRFRNLFYFELIGHALQIKELSDLRLNDSQAEVRFADEKAFIESLTLDAADLQLSGKGLARIDGKLQIAARLTARERLFKQLPGLVRDNFAVGEDKSRYIDFNITGKTSKPKTDLLDKIVGQKIDLQFDDLLSKLWPGSDKKSDDKKKDEKKKKKKKDEAKDSDAALAPASSETGTEAQ